MKIIDAFLCKHHSKAAAGNGKVILNKSGWMDGFNERFHGLFKMYPLSGLQMQEGPSRPVLSATGCISEELL